MKTIILLRHGKAEQGDFDMDDFERALTDRGRKNATEMGKFIFKKKGKPDLILASSAKRTTETAIFASENMNYPKDKIQLDDELYLASARRILKAISNLPDGINYCLMVGHNPGMTDLVNYFGVRLDNLPTASAVCFTFGIDVWDEILSVNAKFQWIQLAKEL